LNCGTEVIGRYCHVCGQENLEPKENFWHLLTHFFYDFTHFDGKFFSTVKYLLIRPGFLSTEYIKGRRQSYLHPIRMYIFTSAFFFILFFWMFKVGKIDFNPSKVRATDTVTLLKMGQVALARADTHKDSVEILEQIEKIKSTIPSKNSKKKNGLNFSVDTVSYKTLAEYDSAQKSLPADQRDNWLEKTIRKKEIQIVEEYKGDRQAFWRDVINNFLHQFPKVFFISLPIFALFLKLLYIRRKQFYYADHAIFTIHLYIFTFIVTLFVFPLLKASEKAPSSIWGWVNLVLSLAWMFYMYKAMRNFYKQGRGKTIVKYILLSLAAFFGLIFLFGIFFTYTILET
jgi:hypothetical protein